MIADERALAAVPAELAPADAAPLLCADGAARCGIAASELMV